MTKYYEFYQHRAWKETLALTLISQSMDRRTSSLQRENWHIICI